MGSAGFAMFGATPLDTDSPLANAWADTAVEVEAKYGEIPYLLEVTFVGCTILLFAPQILEIRRKWRLEDEERAEKKRLEAESRKLADAAVMKANGASGENGTAARPRGLVVDASK